MSEHQKGFLVTNEMMYQKLEQVDKKVTVLLERDKTNHSRLLELESTTRWLKTAVYWAGVPIVVLLGGFEAATRIWM